MDPEPYHLSQLLGITLDSSALVYALSGLFLLLLLIMAALVSGYLTSLFSIPPEEVVHLKNSKTDPDVFLFELLQRPRHIIISLSVAQTFIVLAYGACTFFIAWPLIVQTTLRGSAVIIVVLLLTITVVISSEVLLKGMIKEKYLTFLRKRAGFLKLIVFVFSPLSQLIYLWESKLWEKYKLKKQTLLLSDIQSLKDESDNSERVVAEDENILRGIANFSSISVRQVMTSRIDILAVDKETTFYELLEVIHKNGYSRIPIYSETLDKIDGILYTKDLLPYLSREKNFNWLNLIKPPMFVPENKKVDSLLKDFQEKRIHLAVVVDEYGGTSGIITLEDIIEEIVGEINDEFDEDEAEFHKLTNNTYIFEGKISIGDFCKAIGESSEIFEDVKGESESLGGLLLELYGRLPRIGEKIIFDRFIFTVVSVTPKRIRRVRVSIRKAKENNNAVKDKSGISKTNKN